jgi:DNA-binding IclR family transcriptional regulator
MVPLSRIAPVDSAIAKAFGILAAMAQAKGPCRLSTLAADLGLQKSTVHRVLAELIDLGFVERDEAGLYRPTLRTWEIGTAIVADLPIKQVASTALQQLHARTGETVSLTVRSGDDALYLDKLISPRPVRFTTRVGSRVPLPLTAGGKALLALAADGADVVRRVGARPEMRGVIDVDAVLEELVQARKRGYAVSSARPGVVSIAAAVVDRGGEPVAALSVSAPSERVPRAKRSEITGSLLAVAVTLAESLGRV